MNDSGLHYLTFLRHGESVGNRDRIRQGRAEFPLTDLGRSQAEALLRRWRRLDRTFDLIISSPLERATETAEILAEGLGAQIEMDSKWMERHGGDAQGKPLPRPRPETPSRRSIFGPLFEGGESALDLHVRGLWGVKSLIGRPPGRYLVVSHGAILNAAILGILGVAPTVHPPPVAIQFANSGYMDLSYDPRGLRWRIIRSNVRNHLPERPD